MAAQPRLCLRGVCTGPGLRQPSSTAGLLTRGARGEPGSPEESIEEQFHSHAERGERQSPISVGPAVPADAGSVTSALHTPWHLCACQRFLRQPDLRKSMWTFKRRSNNQERRQTSSPRPRGSSADGSPRVKVTRWWKSHCFSDYRLSEASGTGHKAGLSQHPDSSIPHREDRRSVLFRDNGAIVQIYSAL